MVAFFMFTSHYLQGNIILRTFSFVFFEVFLSLSDLCACVVNYFQYWL